VGEPVTPPRVAALETLRLVRRGELADRALERAAGRLESRDHAWVQELVYGAFRLRGRIDFMLAAEVRGGLESLEPDVLDVLRLGVYQLLEMGSVPPYAAVSQSVELARHAGAGRAAGLVNGVLQSVRRRGSSLRFPDPERDPEGYLSSWGSHPRWLVERWVRQWGAREAAALVEANNRRPELFLRPLLHTAEEAVARLAEAGIEAEAVPFSPDSVRVLPPHGAREALAVLPAVVQDPAAALVASFAAVPADATVLDVCAAPGGKALDLAAGARYVAAADLSFGRLRRVRENVERVGLGERVGLVVADARQPPFRAADAVLLDAPCTGTGTFRRHPDGRWRISPAQLDELAELQREMLHAAAALVRPGGILAYSTCSLEPEENQDQVDWFLRQNPGFRRETAPDVVDGALLDSQGALSVLPQRQGFDGSFAVRLRRVA
jgi:16S rRNA (cytosine967-C5)-methyltransferase